MTLKEKQAEQVKKLREAAFAQDHCARATIELVKLSVEELKESLVSADGEDMYRLQGAARHMAKLYRQLTTEPPTTTKSGV